MSESESRAPADYVSLLAEVKARVRVAQYAALKTVNKELVGLYWDIGRLITERQIDSTHGDAVVERLTRDLQAEFPGLAGFSGATCSTCGNSTYSIETFRKCNRWLHKSVGPTI